jgi:acid phosphatase (class A)
MPQRRSSHLVVAILAVALSQVHAARADATCGNVPDSRLNTLIKLLAPPPCDDCDETKAEVKELTQIQEARTPAEQEHAKADITISITRFFEGANIKFDPAALDKCNDFFEKLSRLTKEASDNAKKTFCRTRPFNLPGNALQPLQSPDELKNVPSYPSGHTAYGTLMGTVLARMLPEKRDKLYARIADYGHSRMIAGVHYRSDIDAGKVLGSAIAADEFAADEKFKNELPGAAACVRKALGLQGKPPAQDARTPKFHPCPCPDDDPRDVCFCPDD